MVFWLDQFHANSLHVVRLARRKSCERPNRYCSVRNKPFLLAHADLFISAALELGEAISWIAVAKTTSNPESAQRNEALNTGVTRDCTKAWLFLTKNSRRGSPHITVIKNCMWLHGKQGHCYFNENADVTHSLMHLL